MAYGVRIADEEQSGFNPGFGGPGMSRHGGYGGRGGGMQRPDGKKILKQISLETGGAYFEVSKKKSVGDIYSEIEEELRNQYSIGYTSDNTSGDSNFRRIALTVAKKGLIIQARDGYYPRTGNPS
jgi:VWFA-related protein